MSEKLLNPSCFIKARARACAVGVIEIDVRTLPVDSFSFDFNATLMSIQNMQNVIL